MYVIKNLKLNKFRPVAIPKASAIFARIGNTGMPASSCYTGDERLPLVERKTDTIARSIADYEQYAREQAEKSE